MCEVSWKLVQKSMRMDRQELSQAACTLNHAGESTPQWKNPLGTPDEEAVDEAALVGTDRLNIKRDKAQVTYRCTSRVAIHHVIRV